MPVKARVRARQSRNPYSDIWPPDDIKRVIREAFWHAGLENAWSYGSHSLADAKRAGDRECFSDFAVRRSKRERFCDRFLDRAKRTPRHHRRWFQISEFVLNPDALKELIEQWRASISHRDLMLNGRSQVLCLSASPLAETRLDPDMARGEENFHLILDELWMSVRGWIKWFGQDSARGAPPDWLVSIAKAARVIHVGCGRPPDHDWDNARDHMIELMCERGEFRRSGGRRRKDAREWRCQKDLVREVCNFLGGKDGRRPPEKTVAPHVAEFYKDWRQWRPENMSSDFTDALRSFPPRRKR